MAKDLLVEYEGKPCYEIKIRDSFSELLPAMLHLNLNAARRVCIVTDSNVSKLYLSEVASILSEGFSEVKTFEFPEGESSKNLSVVEKLYGELIKWRFDRNDLLIALGGGVTGDMTGFAAATYLRGIDFIQIPTTLLSQVDSSIGGKTGVDYMQYKNMVGAFYMPKLVFINTSVLKTLPNEQFASGMAEVIKHGLIRNKIYYKWLRDNFQKINDKDPETLEIMIFESCQVKKEVVENDPTEKGERAVLNFGHTIGHAIEKLSDFSLYHGQCVAKGSVCSAYISYKRGYISMEDYMQIVDTFEEFNLDTTIDTKLDVETIIETTKSDKKMVGDKIKFVTLHGIGRAYLDMDVSDEEMLYSIANAMGLSVDGEGI
ncbi:MAG: 3-dehydroquinate synthase [Lachnospiraceae bacterium]|nr:3-dehydroquinate synthase [Lachnospiraceae bacterium]